MSSRRFLTGLLVACGISAASAAVTAQTRETRIPDSIGDLNSAQLVEVRDRAGKVLLNGTLQNDSTKANEIEREAEVVRPNGGKGKGGDDDAVECKEKNGT